MRRLGVIAAALLACTSEARSDLEAVPCSLAFTHVAVVDAERGAVDPDRTVVVCGRRIRRVGDSSARVPNGAAIIDGRGRWLVPGLWDSHVHALYDDFPGWFAPLMIANGITAIREMGYYPDSARTARDATARGTIDGPRMLISLRLDGQRNLTPWIRRVRNAGDGAAAVREARAAGMDFVKVYSALDRDSYLGIAAEARRLHMPFDGHVTTSMTIVEAAAAGQRTIEHEDDLMRGCATDFERLRLELLSAPARASPAEKLTLIRSQSEAMREHVDEERCRSIASVLAEHGVALTPTLVVYQPYAHPSPAAHHPERDAFVSPSLRAAWNARMRAVAPADSAVVTGYFSYARTLMLHRAGVPLLAGTDTPLPYVVPGFSLHDELELLVRAGLSPLEALRTATTNPARIFGLRDSLGAVRPGQLADLVLVDGNPLLDISNLRRVRFVVANGRGYDSTALAGLLLRARRSAH